MLLKYLKHFNFTSCIFCFTDFWYWSILQQDKYTAFPDRLTYVWCLVNACDHFEFRRHWFGELMWKLNHCRQNHPKPELGLLFVKNWIKYSLQNSCCNVVAELDPGFYFICTTTSVYSCIGDIWFIDCSVGLAVKCWIITASLQRLQNPDITKNSTFDCCPMSFKFYNCCFYCKHLSFTMSCLLCSFVNSHTI